MRAFHRGSGAIMAEMEPVEVEMLASLVEQLQEILGGEQSEVDASGMDAFDWLAATQTTSVELDHSDPLIERLFPVAYDADTAAADDFRRFTEDDSRRTRIAEARVVRDDLDATDEGAQPLWIAPGHVDAWLRTLNSVRLALSVRLGIVDEQSLDDIASLPGTDARLYLYAWYEWLGEVLESLLEAL